MVLEVVKFKKYLKQVGQNYLGIGPLLKPVISRAKTMWAKSTGVYKEKNVYVYQKHKHRPVISRAKTMCAKIIF